jgi:hypothetical protein
MAIDKDTNSFLCPMNRYYGDVKPEHLVFNQNLQEFTHKISFICALETGGKLTSEEAYQQIKELWQKLKTSKKSLGIS